MTFDYTSKHGRTYTVEVMPGYSLDNHESEYSDNYGKLEIYDDTGLEVTSETDGRMFQEIRKEIARQMSKDE